MSSSQESRKLQEATFGAGCFWCVEAVFQELRGVTQVYPGYSGGDIKNPAYREVCNGITGHAEVARITFDPNEIAFTDLLRVFFQSHDPTILNRQGADVGTQYRSVIFYHDEYQRDLAERAKATMDSSDLYANQVVTAIEPLTNFYRAEEDHHNYYMKNTSAPYCQAVVKPKVERFRKQFDDLRKQELKH
ncbi:peptide-methionine (S)-S-oxide reductase MsrA [Cryomorphaceae bacterium 1068]|nr:peptide-methionine (S)-S-oxide reductase MsrA [Cryomorphaceae bacterium 1068]